MGPVVAATAAVVVLVGLADLASGVVFVRSVLALVGIVIGSTVLLTAPRRLVVGLVVWLVFLGLLRRVLSSGVGTVTNDPLLLLGPGVLCALLLSAVQSGKLKLSSAPAIATLVLCGLTVLSVLNPAVGPGAAAFGGLLFLLVPLLWMWIGWAYVDTALARSILRVIAILSVVAAAYALYQVFVGFPSFDQRWIDESGYAALHLSSDTVRPFAMFASAHELTLFLGIGVVVWLFGPMWRLPYAVRFGVSAVLLATLLAGGSRAPVVATVVAVFLLAALRFRVPLLPAVIVSSALAIGAVFAIASAVDVGRPSAEGANASVDRIATGLANPFDEDQSTLGAHLVLVREALATSVHEPLGVGVASVSNASRLSEENDQRSSEFDLGNVALALGLPGLVAFVVLLVSLIRPLRWNLAHTDRRLVLPILGLVLVTFGAWLNGGLYAVSPLPWLFLGWLVARALAGRADS